MDRETEPTFGATTDLTHDRVMVQRFRESFPRARWSDRLNAWFVPGRTAGKGIGRWLAQMEAEADAFADEKGRDAFAFEPIESRYLEASPSGVQIRTPYSRTVVAEIQEIPLAH
jgi:nitrous oxide reductase accessory protein NosL